MAESNTNVDMVRWLEFTAVDIIRRPGFELAVRMYQRQRLASVDFAADELFNSVFYVINAHVFGLLFPVLMLFAPVADLKKG